MRTILLTSTIFALCVCAGIAKTIGGSPTDLAKDKSVFVEPAQHDADVAMLKELQTWAHWKVVADQGEADLIVRLRVSGNSAWGIGHVQAYVLDAKTKKTLWESKDRRGMRTVAHGYASPYTRAISGIAEQMKEEIK